jgi:hypothetical protein
LVDDFGETCSGGAGAVGSYENDLFVAAENDGATRMLDRVLAGT